MTDLLNELIDALRNELEEYGEMLALLDEQQEQVLSRQTEGLLETVARINTQAGVLHRVRSEREEIQRTVARAAGQADQSSFFALAQALPADYRPLLQALIKENNQLLARVQQRARQNHLLLSRSVELMQRLIQSLAPGNTTTVYGGDGAVHSSGAGYTIYEAVG